VRMHIPEGRRTSAKSIRAIDYKDAKLIVDAIVERALQLQKAAVVAVTELGRLRVGLDRPDPSRSEASNAVVRGAESGSISAPRMFSRGCHIEHRTSCDLLFQCLQGPLDRKLARI